MGFPIEPHLEIIGADRVAIEPEDRHLEDSKKSGPSGFRVWDVLEFRAERHLVSKYCTNRSLDCLCVSVFVIIPS